jgi:hypothetical protein
MSSAAAVLLVSLVAGQAFPVPRAEGEFRRLFPHLAGYCGGIRGKEDRVRLAVLPFAPLDLSVRKAAGPDEAKLLRSLYLSVVGQACQVDTEGLANSFHCQGCAAKRRADLRKKLPDIRKLVAQVRATPGLQLFAYWGLGNEHRVNDVVHMMGQTAEATPSEVMGLVPSDFWKACLPPEVCADRHGVPPETLTALIDTMKRLSLAALVREGEAVRVVRVGIFINESGLLFTPPRAAPVRKGQVTPDGRTYVRVERLAPDVLFYETN